MDSNFDIKKIDEKLKAMKVYAEELKSIGSNFPALYRNSTRIFPPMEKPMKPIFLSSAISDITRSS